MYFDLPLDQLKTYQPPLTELSGFDTFWDHTIAKSRKFPLNARFEAVDSGLHSVDVFDITFNGYGGTPIESWLLLLNVRSEALACVVEFIGYGGGRGHAIDWLVWSNVGYAHLIMDTKEQGNGWRPGDTHDPEPDSANPQQPGFMTSGILESYTYYFRRVIVYGVRAVEQPDHTQRSTPKA